MTTPASLTRRIIWLRVRTLASTMISSRLFGDLFFLGCQLLAMRLAGLDFHGGGQTAAEDRLLQLRFRKIGRPRGSLPDVLLSTGVAMEPSPWVLIRARCD